MAEVTRLVRDDAYEKMGASYQCVQVAALDAALQENGIADPAVRQQVCETFMFNMGNFHDQEWLKPSADAEPVYPVLCFSRRFIHTDTPVDALGTVYAPPETFAFHEYAVGCVASFYEGDPAARVETGNFLADDQDAGPDSVPSVGDA